MLGHTPVVAASPVRSAARVRNFGVVIGGSEQAELFLGNRRGGLARRLRESTAHEATVER
jgi:hypothetical protein